MGDGSLSEQNTTLKFSQILPGLLSISWRLPSIIKSFIDLLSFKDDSVDSMGTVLERNAAKFGERTALLYEDRTISHKAFNEAVNRYSNYFIQQGVKKGDNTMVLVDNRPELLMIIGAMSKIGAVSSLINPNQRGEVLLYSINLTRGKVFIVGEELLEAFEEIKPELKLSDGDLLLFQGETSGTPAPDGYVDLEEQIGPQAATNPDTVASVTLGDPFAYVFTSGTTGLPKASVQTHRRWFTAGYWFAKIAMNLKPSDVHYCTLPFCHTNGLHVSWGSCAGIGTALAIRRKFSARSFWSDVRKFKANSFIYIGEICRYLMNQPPQPDDADNPVEKIVGNGLRLEIWTEFKKRFGIKQVYELYGAAEAPLIFTNILNVDKTVGLCLTPFAVVKYDVDADEPVLDPDGFMQRVEPGQAGLAIAEITDKTPFVGYTDKGQTSKKILKDVFEKGDIWFDSGDLIRDVGYRHAQFVDRLGDTFRWKGENVSTGEVEKAINSFPSVSESTVYGVRIEGTEGRAGMASIIPFTTVEDFDLKGFAESIRSALPVYAVPKFLRFKTVFETTGTHKIKKTTLRDEAFDLQRVDDPLYVMLPNKTEYEPLTEELYQGILNGAHRF
ncbi:MAG: long-chain-acyl-CoA synthetase [Proteobacteria bacterium]|nr:long-chain-acyl-CoA synthetase [Pseudomonadota bacterium]